MTHIHQILTCIRNAKNSKLNYVIYTINQEERVINIITILTILRNNGIIRAFSNFASNKGKNKFIIYIKYDQVGNSVIRSVFNVSKPSRKLYISNKSLLQSQSTTGFFVLSTPYGIMTDLDARRYNVGGCVLFGIT